ncbi:nitrate- and nitrite sensing domain-containing protein [Actinoplanes sp. NPDC051470]|uniref:sensor histidine kinase n=1 Tax=Actinoplanes sp. NPDC051470 TaxID=3157224 RepID=UPI0034346685
MTTQTDAEQQSAAPQSIKRRVIRLVLIPGAAALVLWLVASGYLVFTGFYERAVAVGVRQVSIPAVTGLAALQRERRMSIGYLAHRQQEMRQLIDQRRQTDQLLTELRDKAEPVLANAPGSIKVKWETLSQGLDGLPGMRTTIDSGAATRPQVYDFYNGLLDSAIGLFDTQARVSSGSEAALGGIAATEMFRASDLMARSGSIIAGAFGSKALTRNEYLQFTAFVGAYRDELATIAPHLEPRAAQVYRDILASEDWRDMVAAENTLIVSGSWSNRPPRGLPLDEAGWERLSTQVSGDLTNLATIQADEVSAADLASGTRQLLFASIGSVAALLIAAIAIVWAVRQSQILVNSALSVRLSQLGRDAAAVVDDLLPAMMSKLRQRQRVDRDTDLLSQDYGRDEIGQLAQVLNKSLHAAVGAAVDEANARAAGTAMLMGVARRPQRPLQRGLKVVEDLQDRVGDEQLLAALFDINHQMTQTRRFLENLIILAGGQTGRRFQKPVPMRRVLLAAIAETQQYQRVSIRQTADVAVAGTSTSGTIHLLAELLDNALAFSPPESPVWVSSARVERGVVIEIEDGGVGMSAERLEQINTMLATAPTPDVTALRDGAQIGLWVVAELARRDGLQVQLRSSAYGGVLAVVLVPDRALAQYSETPTMELDATVGVARKTSRAHVGPPVKAPVAPVAPVVVEEKAPQQPAAPPPVAVEGRPALPVRRPQEHINPMLREEEPSGAFAPPAAPVRSPDQARERFARYQQGWRAGKDAGTEPDQAPPPGADYR